MSSGTQIPRPGERLLLSRHINRKRDRPSRLTFQGAGAVDGLAAAGADELSHDVQLHIPPGHQHVFHGIHVGLLIQLLKHLRTLPSPERRNVLD